MVLVLRLEDSLLIMLIKPKRQEMHSSFPWPELLGGKEN